MRFLDGVLYDNPTAQGFAEMLPITTETWHAAPGFARAFDLTEQIEQKGTPGYGYEPGSLAYWDEGPSIAMIYEASRRETVVPVVPIGKMTSDASMLEEYEDIITIELVEDEESLSGTGGTLTENSGEVIENEGVAGGNETVFTADTKVWDVIRKICRYQCGRRICLCGRHARQLSPCAGTVEKGVQCFALIYRPGAQTACEDLARAIAFIHENAEELEVDVSGYSLWGGSAGARMAAWLGSYGTAAFGEADYPKPGAVIMQYTGLSEVTGAEPPTYACVGTSDGIAYYGTMEDRIQTDTETGNEC